MKRWLVVLLVVGLIPLFQIYSQTISVSVTDWLMLRTELSFSKERLLILDGEVLSLERNLQQARKSQKNSTQKIANLEGSLSQAEKSQIASEQKISDLKKRLAQAKVTRDQFQKQVESLELQLTELGASLTDTKSQLDQNEADHILEIEKLVVGYERRRVVGRVVGKVVFWTVLAIAVGEGIYILADVLTK